MNEDVANMLNITPVISSRQKYSPAVSKSVNVSSAIFEQIVEGQKDWKKMLRNKQSN